MNERQETFLHLVARLREMGLAGLSAVLLRGFQPFSIVGSQAAHLLTPWLGGRKGVWGSLAEALEDPDQVRDLIDLLEEDRGR